MAARTLDDRYRPFSLRFKRHLQSMLGGAALAATAVGATGCQLDLEYRGTPDSQGVDSCDDVDAELLVQQQIGFLDYRCEGTRYFEFDSARIVDDVDGECVVQATWTDRSYPNSPCDYLPGIGVVEGRPLMVESEARVAPLRQGRSWSEEGAVDVRGLTLGQRKRLAERWQRAGQYEHASIASFARFTLDLMAHGAPPALLLAAQKAAADEVRHAQLCFGLSAAYGVEVEPAGLELPGGSVSLSADLVQLAVDTAREGAIGETLAAVRAAEQLRHATDPAVRAVLQSLVDDEGEHAELAWRTLRWAVDAGGEPVKEALRRVFEEAPRAVDGFFEGGDSDAALRGHGLLSDADVRRALRRALEAVVLPAAAELLG